MSDLGRQPRAWLALPGRALAACLGVGLLVAGPGAAPVHAQVERTGDYLARMDADGDGRVSQAEYLAWMGYAFEQMDRNQDGVLAADELPGGKGQPVSRETHRQRLIERFRRQDVDGNGYLDAKELSAPPR